MILSLWSCVSVLSYYLERMDNLGAVARDKPTSSSFEEAVPYAFGHPNDADTTGKIDIPLL
jgi:hypothetical protein